MPQNEQDLEQQVDQQDEQTRQARLGGLEGMIPQAVEPLDAGRLNTLADMLEEAVPLLSGGQVQDLGLPRVQGPVDVVPREIGAQLLTIAGFIDTMGEQVPGLDAYKFDPVGMMESNQGIEEAANLVHRMAQDPKLLQSLGEPAEAEAPEPAPEPVPDEEG